MIHGLETYAILVSINYHIGPVFNNTWAVHKETELFFF